MPVYKATIEVRVDGDDIDWLWSTLDEIRDMDGVSIHSQSTHHDNPPDYPEYEDE